MKIWLTFIFLGCLVITTQAQLKSVVKATTRWDRLTSASNTTSTDFVQFTQYGNTNRHRLNSPRLTQTATTNADRRGATYWTSSITMQSYGKGKWGTFYYWDVQGNLREMKGFIDIAGKNKRGLKLVFPWR
ncbi:MAG: hypothetical protein RIA63_14365 [Cyclobacteriaceae bacterium]